MHTKPTLIFTIIHGTFAADEPWVTNNEDPGLFRSKLKQALGDDYVVRFDDEPQFTWGHKGYKKFLDNTVKCRAEAAQKLEERIGRWNRTDGARHYLVAHSHGGNVALYALRNPSVRSRIDGLFCMATPFLISKRAPFRRDVMFFATITLILMTLFHRHDLSPVWAGAAWAYTVVFTVAALIILFSGYLGETVESQARIQTHLDQVAFPEDAELSGNDGAPNVWILKVRDDEVGILMKVAYGLGQTIRRSWQLVNRVFNWLLGTYAVTVWVPSAIAERIGTEPAWINSARSIFDSIMTPLLLLATVILLGMAFVRLTFAFDSLRWLAGTDTRSEPTPWKNREPLVIDLDPSIEKGRRHSRIQVSSATQIAELIKRDVAVAGMIT
jgi:hypothetical protein